MAADVVIHNSFTLRTAAGGTRGGRPGPHVEDYDNREEACEALPTVPGEAAYDLPPLRPSASGTPRDGTAFGTLPGHGRTLSAPASWTRAAARMIQGLFERGRAVCTAVISFATDFLRRVGAMAAARPEDPPGPLAGRVDVVRVRRAVMRAADRLCEGYVRPLATCAVHTNTEHVHAHVTIVEAGPESSPRARKGKFRRNVLAAAKRAAVAELERLSRIMAPFRGLASPERPRVAEMPAPGRDIEAALMAASAATGHRPSDALGAHARAAARDRAGVAVGDGPAEVARAVAGRLEAAEADRLDRAAARALGPVLEMRPCAPADESLSSAAQARDAGAKAVTVALACSRALADPATPPDGPLGARRLRRLRDDARAAAAALRTMGFLDGAVQARALHEAASEDPGSVAAETLADLGWEPSSDGPVPAVTPEGAPEVLEASCGRIEGALAEGGGGLPGPVGDFLDSVGPLRAAPAEVPGKDPAETAPQGAPGQGPGRRPAKGPEDAPSADGRGRGPTKGPSGQTPPARSAGTVRQGPSQGAAPEVLPDAAPRAAERRGKVVPPGPAVE